MVETMNNNTNSGTSEHNVQRIRKDRAVEFLTLIGKGKPKEGLRFFAPNCKTHNPYVPGDINVLLDAMIAVQKQGPDGIVQGSAANFTLTVRNVLADGDFVAVHTTLSSSNPRDGGLRQVHLFRFSGDTIVEYWDITQQVPVDAPNAAGAFS